MSSESVKPQKVTKGREVKSRFLNSLFSNKSKTARAGSVSRNQPSPKSRREPSLGPPTQKQVESKKQVESSPKGRKAAKVEKWGSSRSLSLLRQRPKEGGMSKEAPNVSKEKTAEKGVKGKAGKQAAEKVEQGKAAKPGERAAEKTEDAGKEASGRPHLSTDVSADVIADGLARPPAENGQPLAAEVVSIDQDSALESWDDGVKPHVNGHVLESLEASESSDRPEAAFLEAVRERLSLIEVGGASGALDASETDEEMRKERAGSGEGASTRAAGATTRRTKSWTREEMRDAKNSWSTGSRQVTSRDSTKARKQSEWLAALREQNGKPGVGSGAVADPVQRVRKPSEWLVALRERGGEAELRAEDSAGSLTTAGEGLQNGEPDGEAPSSGRLTPGKKARGVVVPSRVWLDSSKSKESANDVDGMTDSRPRRKAVALEGKPVSNGAPTSNGAPARQRAPFSSFGDVGHWLPSSPHKPLETTRSAAGSATTTPAESRATTPSRQETVSAPASPKRTSLASRRKSGGSAPASPKKPSDSAQPRGSSRGRVRPLGGLQSGQDEGGGKVGTSPSKGGQKSAAANGVRAARVLHNRWLQWCFVNARAQAALEAQQKKAEVSARLPTAFLPFTALTKASR